MGDVGDDMKGRNCHSGLMFDFPNGLQSQQYINAHGIQDTTPSLAHLLFLKVPRILPFSLLPPLTISIAPPQ